MAKRSYSRKGSKLQPAVQTLSFNLPLVPSGQTVTSWIDLSQVASLVNRRFYRQGINWAVGGFKFLTYSEYNGSIVIQKLPNTWVMSNAWEKSFRAWTKMNREALAETESVRPKFLDFKIYADSAHHASGFTNNLLPYTFGPGFTSLNTASPGQWDSSKVVVPFGPASPGNTAEHEFIAVGSSFPGISGVTGHNAVSLIEGYAASRGLPYSEDPNAPADADDADGSTPENWLAAMFNDGTDQTSDVLENMITEGNQAPYPFEGDGLSTDTMYPNGANQMEGLQIHATDIVSNTTIGGTTRMKGGNFPCGLIGITQTQTGEPGNVAITLEIDLIPGSHRGYLCEPMTAM